MDIEKIQELLRNYKETIIEMANVQNRYDNKKDKETYRALEFSKYVASNLETKIIDMYITK